MVCNQCGGEMEIKQGISQKTGRPWKRAVCKVCGNGFFLKADQPQKPAMPKTPTPAVKKENDLVSKKAMVMAYAKDLVVALIEQGKEIAEPEGLCCMYFDQLWQVVSGNGEIVKPAIKPSAPAKITPAQAKAIGNLLGTLAWDSADFAEWLQQNFDQPEMDNLTFEQAKEVISTLNTMMSVEGGQ